MKNATSTVSSLIALLFLLIAFTGCSPLTKNIGKKAVKQYTTDLSASQKESSIWQTKDLFIEYDITRESDSFVLSGKLTIKDEVLNSFSLAKFFNLYINFLDKEGKAISIHDVTPNIGYQLSIPPKMNLRNVPPFPPGAESFTFSYWGNLISGVTDGDRSASWEIYFNPFAEKEN